MDHIECVWKFPSRGWVKNNVHSEFIQNDHEGQNRNEIGVVVRDLRAHLLRLTYGTILDLTNLNSALWAILLEMCTTYQDQFIETDNLLASGSASTIQKKVLQHILGKILDPLYPGLMILIFL